MGDRQAAVRPLVAVLVGAVVVVGMVGFSDYGTQQLVDRVARLDGLTDEVVLSVTSSHLWLEEYLGGDEDEGRDRPRPGDVGGSSRIQAELDAARGSCAALWSGGLLDAGVVAALDVRAGQQGMDLCDRLDELHALTVERLADPQASGPGSAIDQRYDAVFFDVRAMAEDLNVAIDDEIAGQREHLSVIAVVLAALALAAFTLMGAFIHRVTGRMERVSRRHGEILDAMPDGVLCVEATGTIVFANAAAGTLVDRDAAELLDLRAQEIVSFGEAGDGGDDLSFAAVLRGKVGVDGADVTCRRADGSTFVAACTTGAADATDATAGTVVVLRDVTQSRAVAAERDEMASIASATSDMAMIGLPDGSITWMNTAARALLGFTADEDITDFRIDDLRTAEEMARVSCDVMPVVAAESRWTGEMAFQPRDGGQLPVSASLHAHTDARGAPRYISAIMHDLRPRQAEEQQLLDSERRLAEAQRIAQVGSFDMDLATHVVVWSDELHRIFGTDREVFEPAYDSFLAAVHGEDRPTVEAAVAEAFANNAEYACEFRIVRPGGRVRVLQARGVVVTGEGPDSARLVGTAQDVTDEAEMRRALDAQLRHVTCLAAVRRVVYEADDVADVCAAAVAALAPAMSHPQLAVATVDLDGHTYCTSSELPGNGERLTAAVVVDGTERGQVRVGYTCPAATFHLEERDLVESVAAKLALWLQRHESRSALAESEARFRRLVDNIPDVVFRYRLGEDQGTDYMSPSVEALTGYSPQEFLVDPQLVNRILVAGGDEAPGSGSTSVAETPLGSATRQIVARDGSLRWVERNIAAVYDDHGDLIALEGVARDVTERTAAEQALEQRAREHAALARFGQAALTTDALADLYDLAAAVIIDTLPVDAVGVSELHPDTGELVLSIGVGWPSGVIGQTRMPIDTGSLAAAAIAQDAPVIVDDLATHDAPDAPFLAQHGMVSGMSVVIGGRGGPYGALGAFSTCPQEYAEAQIRFLQAVAHVLGAAIERTTAQAELARSEQEYRTLAEQMPDVVARYGRDHRYLYVNPSVTALLGMAPTDMIGRTHRELGLSGPFVGVWEDAHEQVFASGQPTTVEGDFPGVAGTVHLHSRIIPEFDSAGTVRSAISVTRDITVLRRTEAQRRDGLVRIVAAQEAERARIGEDIHDDSIQVMTAVGMRLEMLKYQTSDPETLDVLALLEETVRHSIDRLRALMFELLPPELDRDGLCATLKLYLESTATDGLPPWALMNNCPRELPAEIRVVLYRIAVEAIVNARKHAHASHLDITLDDVDGGVRLQVRDNGHGFDTAALAHIGPHHVGTATMRGRAGAADGTVDIHSTPGQGTVVSAWLPCPAPAPAAT